MAERRYNMRAIDIETGEETVQGPFWSGRDATTRAERWAKDFYGSDATTWVEWKGPSRYQVGRIHEDGSRSEPLVTIVIDEEADEDLD